MLFPQRGMFQRGNSTSFHYKQQFLVHRYVVCNLYALRTHARTKPNTTSLFTFYMYQQSSERGTKDAGLICTHTSRLCNALLYCNNMQNNTYHEARSRPKCQEPGSNSFCCFPPSALALSLLPVKRPTLGTGPNFLPIFYSLFFLKRTTVLSFVCWEFRY